MNESNAKTEEPYGWYWSLPIAAIIIIPILWNSFTTPNKDEINPEVFQLADRIENQCAYGNSVNKDTCNYIFEIAKACQGGSGDCETPKRLYQVLYYQGYQPLPPFYKDKEKNDEFIERLKK